MNYALCMACYTGRIDSATVLIMFKAPLIRWNPTDQSPLEFAVMSDNRDIASLLISLGASVYDTDHQGYTALMHSAIYDSPYVTSLLLSHGKYLFVH